MATIQSKESPLSLNWVALRSILYIERKYYNKNLKILLRVKLYHVLKILFSYILQISKSHWQDLNVILFFN